MTSDSQTNYGALRHGVIGIRHGVIGIASFVLGLVAIFVELGIFAFPGFRKAAGQVFVHAIGHEAAPINVMVGACMVLVLAFCLLGLVLGVLGMHDPTSKKVFPNIGLSLCIGLFGLDWVLAGAIVALVRRGIL